MMRKTDHFDEGIRHRRVSPWRAEILSASMDRSQDNDVRCQGDMREVLWKVRRSKPKGG